MGDLRGSKIPSPGKSVKLSVHFWFGFRSSGGSESSDSSVIITDDHATASRRELVACSERAQRLAHTTKSCFSASGFLVIHCNSYIHAAARAGRTLQTAYSAGLIYQCAVDSSRRHRCYDVGVPPRNAPPPPPTVVRWRVWWPRCWPLWHTFSTSTWPQPRIRWATQVRYAPLLAEASRIHWVVKTTCKACSCANLNYGNSSGNRRHSRYNEWPAENLGY